MNGRGQRTRRDVPAPRTREEVERALGELLKQYGKDERVTVETVKRWIREEGTTTGVDDMWRTLKKFLRCLSADVHADMRRANDALQTFVAAWNVFPHRSLGGKAPQEIVEESATGAQRAARQEPAPPMPNIVVGGKRMAWDDYWAMIAEMEHVQKPFKRWIRRAALPTYKKSLRTDARLSDREIDQQVEVAEIFFERVLHVGFTGFEDIRRDFAEREFPHWWQPHVLMSDLSETDVRAAVQRLLQFIAQRYGKTPQR